VAKFEQQPLFGKEYERRSRLLPMLDQQKDISYWSAPARSVLNGPEVTGMGFWSINPYVGCAFGCAYCYARYAHRYVMERAATSDRMDDGLTASFEAMPPWLAFERNIFVKKNAPEVVRRTLRFGSDRHLNLLKGETILIGSATDPYQPAERRFRITRGILESLAEHEGLSLHIITKSPLITRDIDVLQKIARRSEISVSISLITLDRDLARRLEPRAPTPESRVRSLERLRKADIDTSINCMPVLPGITDDPVQLEALVKRVAEAGANGISACALRLRGSARQRYLPFIEQEFPHLAARYNRAYARHHEVSDSYREGLSRFFRRMRKLYGLEATVRVEDSEESDLPVHTDQFKLFEDAGSPEASPV
jgi:DNA repair photolyase